MYTGTRPGVTPVIRAGKGWRGRRELAPRCSATQLGASSARAWTDTPCCESFVPHTPHTSPSWKQRAKCCREAIGLQWCSSIQKIWAATAWGRLLQSFSWNAFERSWRVRHGAPLLSTECDFNALSPKLTRLVTDVGALSSLSTKTCH